MIGALVDSDAAERASRADLDGGGADAAAADDVQMAESTDEVPGTPPSPSTGPHPHPPRDPTLTLHGALPSPFHGADGTRRC